MFFSVQLTIYIVSIGSNNGLVLSGKKPSFEPMLHNNVMKKY